jgi:membrane-bound lytic murein transglycosylase A
MISARATQCGALAICLVAGLAQARAEPGSLKFPDAWLEPTSWSDLDGWTADDHTAGYATFLASCRAILSEGKARPPARRFVEAMKGVCRRAMATLPLGEDEARAFFEENFRPVRIAKASEPQGFLTGYYEPIVAGSRFPTPEFNVPMHRRPDDLIGGGGGKKKKKGIFSNKGKVWRKVGKKSVPYFDRPQIEDGALDGRHLEICWLKDPIDAFFIHIQGSARIQLEDGVMLRINYDAHNGQTYLPVGRILIERGEVTKEEMSMERIRQWMLAHPEEGRELRRMNKSYVFFRITGLSDLEEAIGAQGVHLTPGRSIAIDRRLHLYGSVFWIEADLPIASEAPETKFRRLMVAQDTGSAIVGPSRADIYFGAGDQAGLVGGRIKQPGRFVMLVPREIDPFEKWRRVPMPPLPPEPQIRPEGEPVASAAPGPASPPEAVSVAKAEPSPVLTAGPVPLPKPAPRKASAKSARAKKAATHQAAARPATRTAAKTGTRASAAKPGQKPQVQIRHE